MPQPAARKDDTVKGIDTHIVLLPSPPGAPVPTPLPHPFVGRISGGVSSDVLINGRGAATQGSTAQANSPHIPAGGPFARPPSNQGSVQLGSAMVLVNGKPLARLGDPVVTCNDPVDAPTSAITSGSEDVILT